MSETAIASEPNNEFNCCFKWTDHQNYLCDVVRQLLEEECMVDVTLVADGERIQAHRIVLSSCSTLFQEILSESKEPHTTIILSDISAQDVRAIVEFSYHGEVRIPVENINDLLEAAQSLRICGLMEIDGLDENDAIISTKDTSEENVERLEDFDESCDKGSPLSHRDVEKSCDEEEKCCRIKKKKHRLGSMKLQYSREMLSSAINDLQSGRTLLDAANAHNIPRSTLYMRAKSLGIPLNGSRNEYPSECMKAAIEAVLSGSSLQRASNKYFIPKTVLWRRIQKDGYQILRSDTKRSYASEKREAAVKALERGENLSKVAQEYQIPKTTLFRDKVRLVDAGKLPETHWKKRKAENDDFKRSRLEKAVAACKGGKMSQAAASMAYRIPKTTIWRQLQKDGKTTMKVGKKLGLRTKKNGKDPVGNEEGNPENALCEASETSANMVSSEIPITYMDQNLPTDSVIILTSEDDAMNLDEGEQIIVNDDTAQDYIRCPPSLEDHSETVDYQEAES